MLGLTLALRLAQAQQRVTLFEAAPSLGGLTATHHYAGIHWDRFYHVIDGSDAHLLALLSEIGLGGEERWATTRTNFYDGNALYPLNDVFDYMRLPALGAVDKLRLAANIAVAAQIKQGQRLEKQSAEEWLVRWSGRKAFERLWRPLLKAKLGDNVEHASAAYIWSVIRRFYGARQGQRKIERYGYLPGGYARIIAALVNNLDGAGVRLHQRACVDRVAPRADTIEVRVNDDAQTFDRVLVTFASPLAARICADLPAAELNQHRAIRYQGVVCASYLLKKALGGAYLTYITDDSVPFTAVIEMSSLIDRAALNGHHLIYLPKYLPSDHPLLDAPEKDIDRWFMSTLKRIFPVLRDDDIVTGHIARARNVTAIPTLDYSKNLPPMRTSMPGLYICNSAQILNATLSVNETVELANRTAAMVLRET